MHKMRTKEGWGETEVGEGGVWGEIYINKWKQGVSYRSKWRKPRGGSLAWTIPCPQQKGRPLQQGWSSLWGCQVWRCGSAKDVYWSSAGWWPSSLAGVDGVSSPRNNGFFTSISPVWRMKHSSQHGNYYHTSLRLFETWLLSTKFQTVTLLLPFFFFFFF